MVEGCEGRVEMIEERSLIPLAGWKDEKRFHIKGNHRVGVPGDLRNSNKQERLKSRDGPSYTKTKNSGCHRAEIKNRVKWSAAGALR